MIHSTRRLSETLLAVITFGFLSSCAIADRSSASLRRLSPVDVAVCAETNTAGTASKAAEARIAASREMGDPDHALTSPIASSRWSDEPVARNPSTTAVEELSQSDPAQRRNDLWEVTLNGGGVSNKQLDAGGGSIGASLGYYFTEVVEGSVRQLVTISDPGNNQSSDINGATRLALDLHIPFEHVVPYVGANFGWVYGNTINETLVAGPEGGVKIYVKEDVFVQAGVEYLFFFDNGNRAQDSFDDGQFIYTLGFGLRF